MTRLLAFGSGLVLGAVGVLSLGSGCGGCIREIYAPGHFTITQSSQPALVGGTLDVVPSEDPWALTRLVLRFQGRGGVEKQIVYLNYPF
jgi:hypothetical protein